MGDMLDDTMHDGQYPDGGDETLPGNPQEVLRYEIPFQFVMLYFG